MGAADFERRAKIAPLMQQGAQVAMCLVVFTHEADLHQPPTSRQLGAQNPLGIGDSCSQRLFAEHWLARLQAGDGEVGMGVVGRGD